MFQKYRDPLHLLLEYIAEVSITGRCLRTIHPISTRTSQQVSDCDMVIAHDDDLVAIDGLGHDTVSGLLDGGFIVF